MIAIVFIVVIDEHRVDQSVDDSLLIVVVVDITGSEFGQPENNVILCELRFFQLLFNDFALQI